jgi:mRNA-degrading endonuclease RelE of RelBE toxin-antitoxin system
MVYRIEIADENIWAKDFSSLSKKDSQKIISAINVLKNDLWPENLHVKKLKNYELADFRLRVGSYRVLLDRNMKTKTVTLFRVLHRSKLY